MTFTLFATRKQEIGSAIASIQSQIAILQQQLADEQAFLQEIGTVEQAGESALNQARTFLSMVRAIDPSQEVVFWQAMDALKSAEVEMIAPSSDAQTDVSPVTTSPTPDEPQTVEVDAVAVEASQENDTEPTEPDPAPSATDTTKVEASHQATARSLHKQPAKPLQWLATKRGIDTSNMKRHQIATALVGQVTQVELQEAIEQTTVVG